MPTLDLRIGPEIRKFIDAVNATGDPRRDNERVLEHLAAEVDPFRVLELNKDRERRRPESPWDTLHIEELVIDVIRLCHCIISKQKIRFSCFGRSSLAYT
jgi:hypothetical protein